MSRIDLSRRDLLTLGGQAAALSLLPGIARAETPASPVLDKLTFAGPPAPPTIYLAHLTNQPAMKAHAKATHFTQWRSPDMLISQIANNQIQVSATPSNVAAVLYNKGIRIKLMDITTWGILHLVTRRKDIKSLADIKGKELVLFFRGGMPDIVTRYLAGKLGVDLAKDVRINYATDPLLALKMFMGGKTETAILPEPAATAAVLQSRMIGKPVSRLSLQDTWTEVTGRKRIPQAGTMIAADIAEDNPALLKDVKTGIAASLNWMNTKPDEAAKLGATAFGLKAPIIRKAMENVHMQYVPADEARADLEFFYKALMELSPKLVGGKLPDDKFYLS